MKKIKCIIFLLALMISPTGLIYSDSISSSVNKKGKIVFTNTGPTVQESQQRDVEREQADKTEAQSTAGEILRRHPELSHQDSPKLAQIQSIRDRYVDNGYSTRQALLKAEKEVFPQATHVSQGNRSRYDLELSRLYQKKMSALRRCERSGTSECVSETTTYYNKKINKLKRDPRLYFYSKDERRGRTSSGTVSSGSQQGMFDTNGTYYVPDGAGNHIKTDDGTFMQGVAGGVINTQTGEFMPTN